MTPSYSSNQPSPPSRPGVAVPLRPALKTIAWSVISLAGLISASGCNQDSYAHANRPPPPLGPPVYRGSRETRTPIKPLPDPARTELPPPPFDDGPLVSQRIPEARDFVGAYNAVGHPRIAVFVNRTLEGDIVPVEAGGARVESSRHEVHEERSFAGYSREENNVYLRPGDYDEAQARAIDYAAIEAKLAEWLSADGQVKIVPAATVRERLTDDEAHKLQQGRPRVLSTLAKDLNADVLVQVQARPTRQTAGGIEVRLIAEAIDVLHGESLGHAVTLVPPPLDSETINQYTRFVARKLMSDMTNAWVGPESAPPAPGTPPASDRPPETGGPSVIPRSGPETGADQPPRSTAPQVNPESGPNALPPGRSPESPQIAPEPSPRSPGIPPERPSLLDRTDRPDLPPDRLPQTTPYDAGSPVTH